MSFLSSLYTKSVNINDVFRLGKFSSSFKHPRPILIRLATAWDRKIILLHKCKLRDYKTPACSYVRMFHLTIGFGKRQSTISPMISSLFLRSYLWSLPALILLTLHKHLNLTVSSDVSPVASSRSPSSPDDLLVARSTSPALFHSSSTSIPLLSYRASMICIMALLWLE